MRINLLIECLLIANYKPKILLVGDFFNDEHDFFSRVSNAGVEFYRSSGLQSFPENSFHIHSASEYCHSRVSTSHSWRWQMRYREFLEYPHPYGIVPRNLWFLVFRLSGLIIRVSWASFIRIHQMWRCNQYQWCQILPILCVFLDRIVSYKKVIIDKIFYIQSPHPPFSVLSNHHILWEKEEFILK